MGECGACIGYFPAYPDQIPDKKKHLKRESANFVLRFKGMRSIRGQRGWGGEGGQQDLRQLVTLR